MSAALRRRHRQQLLPPLPLRPTATRAQRLSTQPQRLWQFVVRAEDDGTRLDRFIRRRVVGDGRNQTGQVAVPQALLERLTRERRIITRADASDDAARGRFSSCAERVRAGERVELPALASRTASSSGNAAAAGSDGAAAAAAAPALSEQAAKGVLHAGGGGLALFEDERVVVLNKPAGLASQGGARLDAHQHVDGLLQLAYHPSKVRLVHRLDRDTSGVMIAAKRVDAAMELARAFRERRVFKRYWAIVVEGASLAARGRVPMRGVLDDDDGCTSFRVLQRSGSDGDGGGGGDSRPSLVWLELTPRTGRKHQLRRHCALRLQAPVLGDRRYGARDGAAAAAAAPVSSSFLPSPRDAPLHLHARSVELPGVLPEMIAPPPAHFNDTLAQCFRSSRE